MSEKDPVVFEQAYDLFLRCCGHVERFPKTLRFTLGDRIQTAMLDLLQHLQEAMYRRDRGAALLEAQDCVDRMRLYNRLAKDLRCLSLNQYLYSAERIEETRALRMLCVRGPSAGRQRRSRAERRGPRTLECGHARRLDNLFFDERDQAVPPSNDRIPSSPFLSERIGGTRMSSASDRRGGLRTSGGSGELPPGHSKSEQ